MNFEQALNLVQENFPSINNRSPRVVAELMQHPDHCDKIVMWEQDGDVKACRLSKHREMCISSEAWSGVHVTESRFSVGMWYPEQQKVVMVRDHVIVTL